MIPSKLRHVYQQLGIRYNFLDSIVGAQSMRMRFLQTQGVALVLCLFLQTLQAQAPSDPLELEAFVDGLMVAHLRTQNIPGAVVSIVKDGELFFAKGYGYTDVASRRPVVPDRTLFRLASVSKLFTWTAVMQMVEEGKLDLDVDINNYLQEFQFQATFDRPITLAHLMTHTPGLEDRVVGLFARTPDRMLPLARLLAADLPTRVLPPGELAAYSNHGTALAGYIVQEVSGLPWERYVESRILEPLQMHRTVVTQPLPAELAGDAAAGFTWEDGAFRVQEFEYVPLTPAGGMSASATDMANFMIAHLQKGRFAETRILQESTAELMHRIRFTAHPRLNGLTLGFIEMSRNNVRVIGHGGDTAFFHTLLAIIPDHNLGFFVAFNGANASRARDEFFKSFMDRYFPPPELPSLQAPEDFDPSPFVGAYGPSRRAYTTIDKLASLMGVQVEAGQGVLITRSPLTDVERWIQIEPLVFRKAQEDEHLVFRADHEGRITHLFLEIPVIGFVRLAWYQLPGFHAALLALFALVSLSVVLGWPLAAMVRRFRRKAGLSRTRVQLAARLLGWALAFAGLTFIVLFAASLANPFEIVFGIPPLLQTALYLAPLVLVLGVFVLGLALVAWAQRFWRPVSRVHYTLLAVAGVAFMWQLFYWNLV
jgi:CubicO group peptidase (beta-lactamase class C family)